ncbi:MAG: hypothetical protein MUF12_00980 [Sediminibacterium sp.]|nr:hypothetical protein [Sediminibacterium sp.]
MSYITVTEYLAQTQQGLDIIAHFYPECLRCVDNRNAKFSIREEKTPSATLFCGEDGQWRVMDFGDKSYSCFDLVMRELNCDFRECLRWIEITFNIKSDGFSTKRKSDYSVHDATDEQEAGTRTWEIKEKITVKDCKHIFSKYTWEYMKGSDDDTSSKDFGDEKALKKAINIFEKYNFFFLESLSIVKINKESGKKQIHTYKSNDDYPMCMFQEGDWQKFYTPYSQKHRFAYYGKKPKDYTFGLAYLKKLYGDGRDNKADEVIICTGGSDGLNIAALGYLPVWFNSETVKPSSVPFYDLKNLAWKVYNLPDIDQTGISKANELALHYLDIHTIYLPDELKRLKSGKYDEDGNPKYCKDIKDYLNKYGFRDFKNLMVNAYPLRFWTSTLSVDSKGEPKIVDGQEVYKYTPQPILMRNFLYKSGFGIRVSGAGQIKNFVKVDKNIVRLVQASDMRRFIDDFLENRFMPWDLRTAFLRSKDVGDSTLERLPVLPLDFDDHDRDSQFMFFKNECWKVTRDNIEVIPAQKANRFVWENEVICPKVWDDAERKEKEVDIKLLDSSIFRIFYNEQGNIDIEILRNDCTFLNFLINTSRVHWRAELEDRLDTYTGDKEQYLIDNQFKIDGELLTEDEINEQKQHLIAKLCCTGYFLHRYKDEANTYAAWSMDYVMRDSEKSQGGTGKSLFGKSFFHLMQYTVLDGRDRNLTQNKHIFENVTEDIDYMLLDDGAKYLDFNFFFSSVTSFMKVNPKGTKGFDLMFKDTPKLHISSNFPPMEADDSTLRRLWFLAFSDYYHYNASGEYRQQRLPKDEFGKNLFQNFTPEEWNSFMNMSAECIRAYMNFGKVEPPMHELMANTFRNKLGPNFMQWANFYFQPDNDTLNCYIHKKQLFETYKMEVSSDITVNTFKDKLVMYCRMKYWNLNPMEVKHRQADGRISKKVTHQPVFDNKTKSWVLMEMPKPISQEFIYIQTDDNELTLKGLEEFDGVSRLVPTNDAPFSQPDNKKTLPF